jgi:2-amino-4-hydroxy-6-hydroxymethyldihydropteridine diphosphokinase
MNSKKKKSRAYIGLGSNLGDRNASIKGAQKWLSKHPDILLERCTIAIETPPWGVEDQPPFLNAIAEIDTILSPYELLIELKRGETELGRSPNKTHWGPREIDLDILLFGDEIVRTKDLRIPHPQLIHRRFIIDQLVELNPDLGHPELHLPLSNFQSK